MNRFIANNKIEFLWWFTIVVAIAFISLIWFDFIINKANCPYFIEGCAECPPDHRIKGLILNIIITSIIIGIIFSWFFYFRKKIIIKRNIKSNQKKYIDLACCIIILIIILMYFIFLGHKPINFFENPGGIFALLTGFFTLLGTYWAIRSIVDMKHTITSYPQLITSITELINELGDNEKIKILAYFVLPGHWQIKDKRKKIEFISALDKAKDKIEIICLNSEDHLKILIDVAKKMNTIKITKSAKDIIDFQRECENIIEKFNSNRRLSWDNIPPYFFFTSEKRGIIVTPVGLPKINNSIDSTKVKEVTNIIKNRSEEENNDILKIIEELLSSCQQSHTFADTTQAKVETLGFETTDQHIIDMLHSQFDYYFANTISDSSFDKQTMQEDFGKKGKASVIVTSDEYTTGVMTNILANKTEKAEIEVEVSDKIKIKVNIKE